MFDNNAFNKLSVSERFDLITYKGKFIAVREIQNYIINLHLVDDTFIEFWFDCTEYRIEKIEILEDEKQLSLFIDYMNDMEKVASKSNTPTVR
ncbi:MAG TPA: hypothetical protein PLO29_02530 [Paludibacter sp.]|jgi:hypothetical protein|nr:hypothetical protein [Paludibacter sp.]